jgi:type IV secretory pathway VirB6-like protein
MGVVIGAYDIATESLIAVIFAIWFVSTISLNFVVAFGPLFIAAAFFPYTRRFFDGWVAAVVAAMLTQIFVVALLGLFLGIQSNALTTTAAAFNAGAADPGNSVPGIRNLCTSLGATFVFVLLVGFTLLLAKRHCRRRVG